MIPARSALLAQLGARSFDVLIIGGGIVGAGIARDAAMRGLKVALIEQGDFASGTSSKTSKLIHGGLRYLEHARVRLVFESLRERKILRSIAPECVRPLSLLLPIYAGMTRPAWKVNLGLTLYDLLALGRNIRPHRMVSWHRALELEPGLRREGLRAAGLYADCQMNDARLCLLNILQAIGLGAVCCNYVRLRRLLKANGRICGALGEELFSGRSIEIQAQLVINATGPWADQVRRLSESDAPGRIAPTKGVHLIVPRISQEALFVESRSDHRMLFLLPWGEHTLIGATESALQGAIDELSATAQEVAYLLEEVNSILPSSHIDEEHIIATFAGARPLLVFAGASTQASREHCIEVDGAGLISVMGGKYTTYRLMAKQTLDYAVRAKHWKMERCLTDQVSLMETVQPASLAHWQMLTRSVDPDLLARLLMRYGAGAFHILRLIERDPGLIQPICPHHEHIEAELVYAIQQELACTMTDVLARRTHVAFSSCQGLDLLSRLAELMLFYGGLSREAVEQRIEEYHQFLSRGLAFRSQFALHP
jgi:glycerol-3-phosphate dehydrogenase